MIMICVSNDRVLWDPTLGSSFDHGWSSNLKHTLWNTSCECSISRKKLHGYMASRKDKTLQPKQSHKPPKKRLHRCPGHDEISDVSGAGSRNSYFNAATSRSRWSEAPLEVSIPISHRAETQALFSNARRSMHLPKSMPHTKRSMRKFFFRLNIDSRSESYVTAERLRPTLGVTKVRCVASDLHLDPRPVSSKDRKRSGCERADGVIRTMSLYSVLSQFPLYKLIYPIYTFTLAKPCRVGSVGSVSASRTVGREFASRSGHTKDYHKNGTNCLPA